MTDYKTMRVPADAHEVAKASKRDDETWGDFLRRCADNPPEVREYVEGGDVEERLARIESAVETVEERTGAIDRRLEEMR